MNLEKARSLGRFEARLDEDLAIINGSDDPGNPDRRAERETNEAWKNYEDYESNGGEVAFHGVRRAIDAHPEYAASKSSVDTHPSSQPEAKSAKGAA